MDDKEFLEYCLGMSYTPRCGFVPSQISRLLRLAGKTEAANKWAEERHDVYNLDRFDVRELVEMAQSRLDNQQKP